MREDNKLSRKQIVSLAIGISAMFVLVIGATFSYFAVNGSNTATSSTIIGDIGGDTIGTVSLSGGNANLYLSVSPYDMSKVNIGKTYYSSTADGNKELSAEDAGRTTYTATLSGATSDEIIYSCDYEFSVTTSGTMMNSSSKGDVKLVVEGDHSETISLGSSNTISGTWNRIKFSDPTRELKAYLKLDNTNSSQNSLAGTSLSLKITNKKFDCYVNEETTLATRVMNLVGTGDVNHETFEFGDYTILAQSDYVNLTSDDSEEESTFENNMWKYHLTEGAGLITFNVANAGYYQFCTESSDAWATVYVNEEEKEYFDLEFGCTNLGYINVTDTVKIDATAEYSTFYENFYMKVAQSVENYDAGYRYSGYDSSYYGYVNNYVTFNDELWRIISVEEGSTIGLETGKYYTKIIKDESIGTLPMHDGTNTTWINTSVYNNLNGDYYNGLSDGAKEMIVSPKWYYSSINTSDFVNEYGESGFNLTSQHMYTVERSDETDVIVNNVGLIYPSDVGFTGRPNEEDYNKSGTNVSYLSNPRYGGWLGGGVWTITEDKAVAGKYAVADYNVFSSTNSTYKVRPVVYLDSKVKIKNDGNGAPGNPYLLGF